MKTIRLSPIDARWLHMERTANPMHVATMSLFQIPEDAPSDYVQQLAASFRKYRCGVSPWNLCLQNPKRRRHLWPKMQAKRKIDLDYHFQHYALPQPGTERELDSLISRLHSMPLDHRMPLWECHLIEGLEGNRFAMYLKMHPMILKNTQGVDATLKCLSEQPSESFPLPPWEIELDAPQDDDAFMQRIYRGIDQLDVKPSKLLQTTIDSGKLLGRILRNQKDLNPLAPASSLNGRITQQRRFAGASFSRQRLERIAEAADATTDIVLLYLCSSALRRFFKEYNALPNDPLVALTSADISVSQDHGLEDDLHTWLGIKLATHVADPYERLQTMKENTNTLLNRLHNLNDGSINLYSRLTHAPVFIRQLPFLKPLIPLFANLGIQRVNGSDSHHWLGNAKLLEVASLAHLLQNQALSIDITNYADQTYIGVTGARENLPHLQLLIIYMEKALVQLESMLLEGEQP